MGEEGGGWGRRRGEEEGRGGEERRGEERREGVSFTANNNLKLYFLP